MHSDPLPLYNEATSVVVIVLIMNGTVTHPLQMEIRLKEVALTSHHKNPPYKLTLMVKPQGWATERSNSPLD